jgi:LuxR family maltose regulon positive regulatory protein
MLHARASRWYAQYHQITAAILHAFSAQAWHWAADLLEQAHHSLVSFTWGANHYALVQFQRWIEQLPAEILACRPHFCLACVHLLSNITPHALLFRWLDLAEAALRTSLKEQIPAEVSQGSLSSQGQQEQRELLGEMLALRTLLLSYTGDGPATLELSEQALALLSPENGPFLAIVSIAKAIAYWGSSANNIMEAIKYDYQAILLTQEAKQPAVTCCMVASAAIDLIAAGHLEEIMQLTQQTLQLWTPSDGSRLPEEGWIMIMQAEILRERNQLACAHALAREAISLCEQAISVTALIFLFWGYAILTRICLSLGDVDGACMFLQQAEQIGQLMTQPLDEFLHSDFTIVDQVRLWLACGELDRATRWVQELDLIEQYVTPFARERQEVARARILLAKDQPTAALQRLEPALQRATAGQRWGHMIEIRFLQALAHQKLHEVPQALAALSEAVRLGEPEGYIRSFVEEGEAMGVLLCKLREEQRKREPTPYLDRVLAAFPKPRQTPASQSKRMTKQPSAQPLLEPLSEREQQVLELLAKGATNQEIAQELMIVVDTVKRHMSHILDKLGVHNRVQAVRQARRLGLLDEEP